jgi:hypothetical protein
MSLTPQRPIIVDIQQVENHPLYCSICCDIAIIDPVITPCNHIFCLHCITQGLERNSICPNDRTFLSTNQLRKLSGVYQYLHDHIVVRCPKCAKWDGKLQQYKDHVKNCSGLIFVQQSKKFHDSIAELEKLLRMPENVNNLARATTQFENNINTTEYDRSYKYDWNRVVELSQLICRYLENKPNEIDRNRIFNCIKLIHDDYVRGWNDNPPHFSLDIHMLLSICKASTWFSQNQRTRILEWMEKF